MYRGVSCFTHKFITRRKHKQLYARGYESITYICRNAFLLLRHCHLPYHLSFLSLGCVSKDNETSRVKWGSDGGEWDNGDARIMRIFLPSLHPLNTSNRVHLLTIHVHPSTQTKFADYQRFGEICKHTKNG